MIWAFVDYENVGSLKCIDLEKYDRVIIFLGAVQSKLNFTDVKADGLLNLTVLKLDKVGKNNLDFHIAYYLGKFDCQAEKDIKFHVISNDAGFDGLIGHLANAGRACKRVGMTKASKKNSALHEKIIATTPRLRPQTLKKLRSFINSSLKLGGDDKAAQRNIDQLVSDSVISIHQDKVIYKC